MSFPPGRKRKRGEDSRVEEQPLGETRRKEKVNFSPSPSFDRKKKTSIYHLPFLSTEKKGGKKKASRFKRWQLAQGRSSFSYWFQRKGKRGGKRGGEKSARMAFLSQFHFKGEKKKLRSTPS